MTVYLYPQGSYGRRHIANLVAPCPSYGGDDWRLSYCSAHFRTDEAMCASLRRWNTDAERWITKRRAMPVCKVCQKIADRRTADA